jgi:hypothetical protein
MKFYHQNSFPFTNDSYITMTSKEYIYNDWFAYFLKTGISTVKML